MIARLRPETTLSHAEQEMGVIAGRLARDYPQANGGDRGVTLVPLRDQLVGNVRPALIVLSGAGRFGPPHRV